MLGFCVSCLRSFPRKETRLYRNCHITGALYQLWDQRLFQNRLPIKTSLTEMSAWGLGRDRTLESLMALNQSLHLFFFFSFSLPSYCKQMEEAFPVIKSISLCISTFLLTHGKIRLYHTRLSNLNRVAA